MLNLQTTRHSLWWPQFHKWTNSWLFRHWETPSQVIIQHHYFDVQKILDDCFSCFTPSLEICFGEWGMGRSQQSRGHVGNPVTQLAGSPADCTPHHIKRPTGHAIVTSPFNPWKSWIDYFGCLTRKPNQEAKFWLQFGHCYKPASEEAMASHSSALAWKIPWAEETGGLQSMGSGRVGHNWATFHFHALEKEMAAHSSILAWRIPGTEAWWAAVYGVAQSRTRLVWLGGSSSINLCDVQRSQDSCLVMTVTSGS